MANGKVNLMGGLLPSATLAPYGKEILKIWYRATRDSYRRWSNAA